MSRATLRTASTTLLALAMSWALPLTAFALTPQVGSFGNHTSGGTPNFITQPIGSAECTIGIPITLNPVNAGTTNRYIDIWSASSSAATCGTAATRALTTTPTCEFVTSIMYTGAPSAMISPTASELFGSCMTNTRTFFFFDSGSSHDIATNFTSYWTLDVAVDATAPSAPTLSGNAAGDSTVVLSWTNPTDLGTGGGVNVYYDPAGCSGGDGGASSSLLMPGTAPNDSTRVFQQLSSSITSVSVSTGLFGWSSATHGQTGAVAIAVMDNARNLSVLSNVVCVSHVVVTGFWESYCAAHGMPDIAQCTANYHGCSVGLPGRRTDLGAIAFLAAVVGVVLARRGRRRAR